MSDEPIQQKEEQTEPLLPEASPVQESTQQEKPAEEEEEDEVVRVDEEEEEEPVKEEVKEEPDQGQVKEEPIKEEAKEEVKEEAVEEVIKAAEPEFDVIPESSPVDPAITKEAARILIQHHLFDEEKDVTEQIKNEIKSLEQFIYVQTEQQKGLGNGGEMSAEFKVSDKTK